LTVGLLSFAAVATALPLQGNLVARFSADRLALANGANVTSWTDSVNGIVADTVSGTAPTFATNRVNSKPAVQFSAGGLSISTPGALKTALDSLDYTVIVAFRTLGTTSSDSGCLFSGNSGTAFQFLSANGTTVGKTNDGGNSLNALPLASQNTDFTTLGSCAFTTAPPVSNQLAEMTYVNGGCICTLTNPEGTGGKAIFIGTNDISKNFNGEIFEILVWNTPLTPPQYMQAEMALRDKYSLAHPWAGLSSFNVFHGDSITDGINASGVAHCAPYLASQSLGLNAGQWSNLGWGGATLSTMTQFAPTWIDPIPALIGKPVNVVAWEFVNSNSANNQFAAPSITQANSYLSARKAVPNIRTVWGTSTSLNANFSGDMDPVAGRADYNAAFDAAPTVNIDSYMPIHLDTHIGVDGSYATFSTPTGGDGIHLTDTTYPFLAALYVSGIQALSP
jgi:hypothetical protein